MARPCSSPIELARKGQLRVHSCRCGAVHLDLGPFTVRMEREALGELRDLLDDALVQLSCADALASVRSAPPIPVPHLQLVASDASPAS